MEKTITLANESTIPIFWKEHVESDLRIMTAQDTLYLSSPCWKKNFMNELSSARRTLIEVFVQDITSMSIILLLALFPVFPRSLFFMGRASLFHSGVVVLRIDGCLTLSL